MIAEGEYGYTVSMVNNKPLARPLEEVAGKTRAVDPEDELIEIAKRIGVSFGN